jgi:hypothetical protein
MVTSPIVVTVVVDEDLISIPLIFKRKKSNNHIDLELIVVIVMIISVAYAWYVVLLRS